MHGWQRGIAPRHSKRSSVQLRISAARTDTGAGEDRMVLGALFGYASNRLAQALTKKS